MKRRVFMAALAAAAAWPVVARAQLKKIPRVGLAWIGSAGANVADEGLRKGFAERGWVVGRDLEFEVRHADGHAERMPDIIAELLASGVDVLVTPGTQASLLAKAASSTVPIVSLSGNPVGSGLAASLAHPGGNVTGLSVLSSDHSAKWLALLQEAVPALHRVAVLINPDNSAVLQQMLRLEEQAAARGMSLTRLSERPAEIEASLSELGTGPFDGLIATDDPLTEQLIPRLVEICARRRLPALYALSTAVPQGGLMSYSANFLDIWRRAAGYVDRILKGAKPADLPIEQATEIVLAINLKTAKALGLEIPPTLLAEATEVIE
jgi:putative ABC transport system substrate-binding protein